MMRFVTRCGFATAMLILASCGVADSAFALEFYANLTPSHPSEANGVTAALIYGDVLVVNGTFSGLSGTATGAAILDGDRVVVDLIIVHQDTTHGGAFERFFDVAGHENALDRGRYEVRVMTAQDTAGELKGRLLPLESRPFSLDLGTERRK
jgi:hypothetical protein